MLLKSTGGKKNNWLELAFKGGFDNQYGESEPQSIFSLACSARNGKSRALPAISGQGPSEIMAGLGALAGTDVIASLWPSGILEDELQVAGGEGRSSMSSTRATPHIE